MKVAGIVGLLCMSVLAVAASAAPSQPLRFMFCGTEYVGLEDWAESKRYKTQWVTPKQEVVVSSTWSRFAFTVDSRKMSYNGVTVYLSHPIGLRNGAACIAWKDLTTTLQPLLSPPKNAKGKKIELICLDPGHGGRDPGNEEGRQSEKKYTLLLAREISSLLAKAGLKTELTRSKDVFVELVARTEFATRRKADLFVSLHFNSADGNGGANVRGAEVYCMTPAYESSTNARGEGANTGACPGNRFDSKNLTLGYQIQKALVKKLPAEDRGVRRARFAVLREAEMPAVLIEGGFMSHNSESKRIYDSAWRRELAKAIVEGILAYKKIVES